MLNKKQAWGGQRRGAGRPLMKYGRQVLILDCTSAELEKIRLSLTTRQRVEVLLAAQKTNR